MDIRWWQPTAGIRLPCKAGALSLPLLLPLLLLLSQAQAAPVSAQGRSSRASRTTDGNKGAQRITRRPRWRVKRDKVAGGPHWRLSSGRRVIHVWRPPGYRGGRRAGIVLYIHGYHITVDRTWHNHRLPEQFKASRQNALFIAVSGPKSKFEHVKFKSLREVLQVVARWGRIKMPRGQVVVVAHSSGFRTAALWLGFRNLAHVILLDALFSAEDRFFQWMTSARLNWWHRLTLVGKKSAPNCVHFLRRFKYRRGIHQRKKIPRSYARLSSREKWARILYLRSQYGHSAMVYNRKVIPVLLRRTRLKMIR